MSKSDALNSKATGFPLNFNMTDQYISFRDDNVKVMLLFFQAIILAIFIAHETRKCVY